MQSLFYNLNINKKVFLREVIDQIPKNVDF